MDLNDYWQENKRFVTIVVGGLVVFLIAYFWIDGHYGDDIGATRGTIRNLRSDLGEGMYTASDLTVAEDENEALKADVAELEGATRFRPREEFVLDENLPYPSQYLRVLNLVREDLLPRANQADLTIDSGLGMPKFSPTVDAEIERYVEALDVIETVASIAIDSRVRRIEGISIRLDPGLTSRAGLGRVEHTRVSFDIRGPSLALTRLVAATQRPRDGRVLHVADLEMRPTRHKDDEVQLDLVLTIPRLREIELEEEG